MKSTLISIIVPVYKVEEYINKCVDSIINQTYKNLEIILVDDGSPDNCPKICDEYAKKDSRIKVIHKPNGGLSDARNRGIKEATGEYIGFIDSDDYIDEGMYEYLYELIKKYDADISICGHRDVGLVNREGVVPNEELKLNNIEALKILAEDGVIKNHAVTKLYKRSLFIDNNIEYPVGKIMEDILTTYKLIEKSKVIVVGTKTFYNYLKREDSITGKKSAQRYISHVENSLVQFEHFKENEQLGFYFFKNVFYVIMRVYIDDNDEAIKYLDDNRILENHLELGKEKGYYNKLGIVDKLRLILFKRNRKLYKSFFQNRRKLISKIKG